VKLSDYVVQFIADQGVRHVFFLPGGGAMHLNDSLARCHEIEFVCNLHEQASAIAAEAYSKVSGNLGVAMVTSGPGGTNAITGVAAAWLDSTPCIFLSGQAKRPDLKADTGVRQLGSQEVDIVSIVSPITKYAVTILDPGSIRYHLEKATYLAKSGRPGPVWIDIPLDVQAASVDPQSMASFQPQVSTRDTQLLQDRVRKTIQLLNASERPVIVAGNGVHLAHAERRFAALVDALSIPVLTSWLALDLIPDSKELAMGRPGAIAPRGANFTLQNADLLLILGTRLDAAMTGYSHPNLARAARKVMVDVDLAEIRKMKTCIDVPIHADAGEFVEEMLRQRDTILDRDRGTWISLCQDWKAKYPVVLPEHRPESGALSTYHFAEVLSGELREGDIVASGSSGFACEIFLLVVSPKTGQRIFHARGLGAMGFGLPASIGACLAANRQPVVCVDGDGGFQMNVQELATVAHHKLPIKFFVVNNDGYASIRSSQSNYFQKLAGADSTSGLGLPDIGCVARAYGIPAVRLDSQADLRGHIKSILREPGPMVCEVVVLPDEPRAPRLASMQRPDGSMVSKPLEDLWPFLDRDEFRQNMLIPTLED
jgi:acetolactate synthase-1/2/3 large subunit